MALTSRAFWFRLALLGLLLTLAGCVPAVIADPCNPAWDSQQVTGAFELRGLLTLALVIGGAALAGALVLRLFTGGGRR